MNEQLARPSPEPPRTGDERGAGAEVVRCPDSPVGRAVAAFADFHQCLHAQQQSCWEDLDLTMSQFKALMLISASGGLSGRDLARRFGVGPSAITAVVDRLVQRGYARREEDAHDRRISWTRPTPAAIALFQQVNAGHDEQLDEILRTLPPDELENVERTLLVLRDAGARWLARQSDGAACVDSSPGDQPSGPTIALDTAVLRGSPTGSAKEEGATPA